MDDKTFIFPVLDELVNKLREPSKSPDFIAVRDKLKNVSPVLEIRWDPAWDALVEIFRRAKNLRSILYGKETPKSRGLFGGLFSSGEIEAIAMSLSAVDHDAIARLYSGLTLKAEACAKLGLGEKDVQIRMEKVKAAYRRAVEKKHGLLFTDGTYLHDDLSRPETKRLKYLESGGLLYAPIEPEVLSTLQMELEWRKLLDGLSKVVKDVESSGSAWIVDRVSAHRFWQLLNVHDFYLANALAAGIYFKVLPPGFAFGWLEPAQVRDLTRNIDLLSLEELCKSTFPKALKDSWVKSHPDDLAPIMKSTVANFKLFQGFLTDLTQKRLGLIIKRG
jgi:hypothetical protein